LLGINMFVFPMIHTASINRLLFVMKTAFVSCEVGTIYLSIYGSAVLLLDLGRFFSFSILYTVGRTPWTGDQPVARPLPTLTTT
jgi:hypothetical protein